ncbi:hypothetical protein ZWY2020_044124 [Hordeum vulgare]|nr:hypothetical protein ZWY2020_044124 [Hordeum vulgare]
MFGLPVPPSAKRSRPWRISAHGHPTLGPPASREELRRHPGDRYDRRGCRRFWTRKNFDDVVGAFRRVARGLPAGDILEATSCRHITLRLPVAKIRWAAIALSAGGHASRRAGPHHDGDPDDTLVTVPGAMTEEAMQGCEEVLDERSKGDGGGAVIGGGDEEDD